MAVTRSKRSAPIYIRPAYRRRLRQVCALTKRTLGAEVETLIDQVANAMGIRSDAIAKRQDSIPEPLQV